jgi:hypothetical protein
MGHDQPDARVAAAAAHWSNRFTANGTDYGDFAATLARITRWEDWCREWGVTAARYEQLAEAAGVTNRAYESRSLIADWLADRLA